MKTLILALGTLFSLSAFATSDSYQRFYYPYAQPQEDAACMGSHLFHDGIGTSESAVRGTLQALKSRVNVSHYGADLEPQNINLLVYGPDSELFNVEDVNENDKGNYIQSDIVLDFAAAKKLDPVDQEKSVLLAYYAVQKSLAKWGDSSNYYLTLRLNNSPVAFLGEINLTEPTGINGYTADLLKLELQKKGLLALDYMCQ